MKTGHNKIWLFCGSGCFLCLTTRPSLLPLLLSSYDPWCSSRGQTALRSQGQPHFSLHSFCYSHELLVFFSLDHLCCSVPLCNMASLLLFPQLSGSTGPGEEVGVGTEEGAAGDTENEAHPVTSLVQPGHLHPPLSRTPLLLVNRRRPAGVPFPPRLHTMNSLLPYRTSCCGPELKSDSLRWLPEVSRGELRLSRSLCWVLPAL